VEDDPARGKKHRVELDKLDTKARLKTLDKYVRAELRREATSEAMAKVRARSRPEAAKKIHKVLTHLAKLRKAHPKEFDKVVNQIEEEWFKSHCLAQQNRILRAQLKGRLQRSDAERATRQPAGIY
jgi:rubrerythrin